MKPNVECSRCGHKWYADQYDRRGIVPHYCTRCYRKDVRPIPEEPTVVEKKIEEVKHEAEKVPEKASEFKKELILWKENNRYLIDMAIFGIALLVIFGVLYLFIFVWG